MKEQFNLSEEIKDLRKKMREAHFKEDEINFVLVEVLLMDKEFIRLLKEKLDEGSAFYTPSFIFRTIDALAGDKLK